MGYEMDHISKSIDKLEDTISDAMNDHHSSKESSMNNLAGLLALIQGNRNMDIPGLLALCKERGYDNGWGGEGMFMFVFLLLFLFAGNGWNGLNRNQQADFACHAGSNCSQITGLYDRIYAAQAESAQGFNNLQTWLCQSIDAVNAATRDQGDRNYDATRNVGDAVRDCCCKLEAHLASLGCEVRGVQRDIREMGGLINAKVELEALKAENARSAMECRLSKQIEECCCETKQQFADLKCTINTNRLADENARLARENEALKDTLRGDRIADAAVHRLEKFAINHYTPTRTGA